MTKYTLPQQTKLIDALPPATDAAGRTSRVVNLKNYGKAYILITIAQGNAATIALTLRQSLDVAGTGAKALSGSLPCPIWFNLDTSLTDTLVRQTDGIAFTTDAGVKNKQVVFEVDPSNLDFDAGFDCLSFTTGASNVANITQAQFLLVDPRYAQQVPPSAIVD